MATSFVDSNQNELSKKFESWLTTRIKSNTTEQDSTDTGIFINYILSTLAEEDNSDEDKCEAIQPFLQELNQNNLFDEAKLLKEIIETWKEMKEEYEKENSCVIKKSNDNEPNPTDTILSMINKHKNQLVKVKKSETQEDEYDHSTDNFVYEESDEDEENESKKAGNLFENNNLTDALHRDKQKRDKLAEAHMKQKEQAKKALIEQKQREEDKKKKAQQKAAKVERKR